ncbi:glycoside hydrolase family 18 protein [Pseudomassariella vexata]|uniref:Glycoside hydrolase family 18 protein n=1 Tax=Pseudomassariella vexata TaxID=1141098 RepID=A0A1Y2EIH4_9PEZI|nr:glycoside hydrolase family 18 protein [Pseudomassariella vexata]ORY71104.1 glycoside hydrolase family 18 protein [Pseudomassariella vexata]
MAPIRPISAPRIVLYHQTTHNPDGSHISILPLLTQPGIALTHLIVAAIHINEDPNAITLNDHHPSDPRYTTLWAETRIAQASGIQVLGMLGGAAKGSYCRLDKDEATFEAYYVPVRDLIRQRGLQGLDLDVEEDFSLGGMVRLIDRLRLDFGAEFLITLAPVAAALLDVRHNMSGFDYEALEVMRGKEIAWYNAQFYNGWGNAGNPFMYELMVARGWPPEKVVVGLLTTGENGNGFVPWELMGPNLGLLRRQFERFGGVMGWEYFNSSPGGRDRPWEWAQRMTETLRAGEGKGTEHRPSGVANALKGDDEDDDATPAAPLPAPFVYQTDGEDA